jgi:acrylyl-CoA reductase (NADPH)
MTFRAFVVEKTEQGWVRGVRDLTVDDLPEGDVLIEVERSGINYKDGLASIEKGRVARISPLVPASTWRERSPSPPIRRLPPGRR